MTEPLSPRHLGWSAFFQSQLSPEETTATEPARISAVHRDAATALGPDGPRRIPATDLAVGDWVLTDRATGRFHRRLDRETLLSRRAAGTAHETQLIAANVDTLFIVSSCNADFNLARLERYLVLARQSGMVPVVVLTKADSCPDPDLYRARAAKLAPMLVVETLNALDPAETDCLRPWCGPGETVALVGSSGVGKSTLISALIGEHLKTGAIREDDARGRHTTTARSLHPLPSGGWLIDTPGMRALRLHDAAEGVAAVFEDLGDLAETCRFADCAHDTEPGCAIQAAIAEGTLDPARLDRWRKLAREEAHNTASVAEQRRKSKAFGRMQKRLQTERRDRQDG